MLTIDYIEIQDLFKPFKLRVNNYLQQFIDNNLTNSVKLNQAVKYSLLSAGKRVRAVLVYILGQYLGINLEKLDPIAASIEIIHCYSLIHDDLPAMDNDDFRRGQLSCHKKFDEATAILAGDGLQSLAFELLAAAGLVKQVLVLAQASGLQGMVLGQGLDLAGVNNANNNKEQIDYYKTGKLFQAAIEMVRLAGIDNIDKYKNNNLQQYLTNYGYYLGLIFQLKDDVLDSEGDINKNKITIKNYSESAVKELEKIHSIINGNIEHLKLLQQIIVWFAGRES